jgi:hypothetical protein
MIQLKAQVVARSEGIGDFAASGPWLEGFKRRQHLSLRTRGTQGQRPPDDLEAVAERFGLEVAAKARELGVDEVWNADETAVFFELLPRRTVDERGARTVWVRCAGAEKRRVSVLLLGSSLGCQKTPFIVMKEVPSRVPCRQAENDAERNGFGQHVWDGLEELESRDTVFANKAGWLTGPLIVKWLELMFGNMPRMPRLLLLDEFSGHWTEEVLAKCEELQLTLLRIPAGCTSVCQPADVSWNKPFKAEIRKLWVDRLVGIVENNEPFTPPSRIDVCNWVLTAWRSLETIENGFQASRIPINTDAQVAQLALDLKMAEITDDTQIVTEDE